MEKNEQTIYIVMGVLFVIALGVGITSLVLSLVKTSKQGPTGATGATGPIGPMGPEGPMGTEQNPTGFDNGVNGYIDLSNGNYTITSLGQQFAYIRPKLNSSKSTSVNNIILGLSDADWQKGTTMTLHNAGSTSDFTQDYGVVRICSGCIGEIRTNCDQKCTQGTLFYSIISESNANDYREYTYSKGIKSNESISIISAGVSQGKNVIFTI